MDAPPPLPDLREGHVDAAGLAALLDDIAATGGVLAVVARDGRRAAPPAGPAALPAARAALLDGRLAGLQLRYLHDGREWFDTLLPAPGGWRVVRIAHDPTPGAGPAPGPGGGA